MNIGYIAMSGIRLVDDESLALELSFPALFDFNFQPTHMSDEQLKRGFHQLTRRLYSPEFVDRRSRSFRKHLRHSMSQRP